MQVPPTAIVISLVSLAFSFSTTFVAYWRTHVQDIQAVRQELRKLLERLISIPRESLEANKKYAGDRGTLFGFDQLFNQENTLLRVRQRRLPVACRQSWCQQRNTWRLRWHCSGLTTFGLPWNFSSWR